MTRVARVILAVSLALGGVACDDDEGGGTTADAGAGSLMLAA